jgi:hypothetical protein
MKIMIMRQSLLQPSGSAGAAVALIGTVVEDTSVAPQNGPGPLNRNNTDETRTLWSLPGARCRGNVGMSASKARHARWPPTTKLCL